jgi:hypothetical protein
MLPPPRGMVSCYGIAPQKRNAIEMWWIIRFSIFVQISLKHTLSEIFGCEESMTRNEFAPDVVGDMLLFSLIENPPVCFPVRLSRCPGRVFFEV